MAELMRLRIPMGWTISYNRLFDANPIEDDDGSGWVTNWFEGFTEDVLWIQECKYDGKKYSAPKSHSFHIDISWLPGNSISGQYYAKLQWCSDDELINVAQIDSQNRFEIRDKLEFWMSDISENYPEWREKMLKL